VASPRPNLRPKFGRVLAYSDGLQRLAFGSGIGAQNPDTNRRNPLILKEVAPYETSPASLVCPLPFW